MRYILFVVLALTSCTLPPPDSLLLPAPDVPPVPAPVAPPTTTVFLSNPVECVDVVTVGMLVETPMPPPPKPVKKAASASRTKDPSPQQVVAAAQVAARVLPTAQGFFGQSAELTYTWQPGKVYQVYLSPHQATAISLPKGETLAAGLYLDPEAYEVKNTRLGGEVLGYDVLTIRPLKDSGELDTFVLGESGRKYLLHFTVAKTAMLSVVFETPHIAREDAPRLPLPRPPQ